MEFYEVIKKRHTIREFSSKSVEREKLQRVLEAGLCAPTHNHLRQWEYILVSDHAIRQVLVDLGEKLTDDVNPDEMNTKFKDHDPSAREMYLQAVPMQKRMLLTAPELLVLCYKAARPIKDCTKIYELNSLASAWCCIENILLAMAAEGLFGVTYIPQNTDRIRQILSIPEDYEIPVILPIGYPREDAKRVPQKPVSLQEKIHFNRF